MITQSQDANNPAAHTRNMHCGARPTQADNARHKRRGEVLLTLSNSQFEVSSGRQSASPNLAIRGGALTKQSFPNTDP